MKFLLVSNGDGMALVPRLIAEGNEVVVYLWKGEHLFDGMGIRKVTNVEEGLSGDPVIVFDETGKGRLADRLRSEGRPVLWGSSFFDKLEFDRGYVMKLMKDLGISVPPYREFTEWESGIEYARRFRGEGLYFKPSGSYGNENKNLTFGSDSGDILAERMKWFRSLWKGKVSYILQERVEGTEVDCGLWFNGRDPVPPFYFNMEDKKQFAGDLGPNTGCMSMAQWPVSPGARLIRGTLLRLLPVLREVGIPCSLDFDQKGGHFIEICPRPGYDSIWCFFEQLDMEAGQFLSDIARGQARQIPMKPGYAFALRLQFPSEGGTPAGIPLPGLKPYQEHLWLGSVTFKEGQIVSTGDDAVLGVVTRVADTLEEARDLCIEEADRLRETVCPDLAYRIDAGDCALESLPEIERDYEREPEGRTWIQKPEGRRTGLTGRKRMASVASSVLWRS